MPGHEVSIRPGYQAGRSVVMDGTTFYEWNYLVTVDGEVGIYTDLVDFNDPGEEPDERDSIRAELEGDPSGLWRQSVDPVAGEPEGIAQNDSPADAGGATAQNESSDDFWASVLEDLNAGDPYAEDQQSTADDGSGSQSGDDDDDGGGDTGSGDDAGGYCGGGDDDGGHSGGGDDGNGGGDNSSDDPDGGDDESPGLGRHSHHGSRSDRGRDVGSQLGGHTTGYDGDPDSGGGGWGWSHFGSPRADDGDGGGDEGPSLGDHSGDGGSGHGGHSRGGGGQRGSVDDQQYLGGGYGWTTLGAPRAVPGSVGSAGVTLTLDSGHWPSTPFGARRTGSLLLGLLLLALLTGTLLMRFGGADQHDTAVVPAAVSAATPTPTATAVAPVRPIPYLPPPAAPVLSTPAESTTPTTTVQVPPPVVIQIATAPTTSAAPRPKTPVVSSSRPIATFPPTSVRKPAPPAPSTTHKRHGGGSNTDTAGGNDGSARSGSAGGGSDTSARG